MILHVSMLLRLRTPTATPCPPWLPLASLLLDPGALLAFRHVVNAHARPLQQRLLRADRSWFAFSVPLSGKHLNER